MLSGLRSSMMPRPLRNETTGALMCAARARISAEACWAPPPTHSIGALASSSSFARAAMRSGSGCGFGCRGSGSCGVISAEAVNWSQGISSATGPGRPDSISWKARAVRCEAWLGCSMRSTH